MRLLHTSDFHLGHRLLEHSRIAEQERFLRWLAQLVQAQKVDLLIIAGDIFDTGAPPNAAIELYYDFLYRLSQTDCRAAVVIGGNHDSVSTLNAPRRILQRFRVHVVGGAAAPENEVYILKNEQDQELARVGCVPFLRERELRAPRAGESIQERDTALVDAIRDHYRAVADALSDGKAGETPVIYTGHLFPAGSSGIPAGNTDAAAGERDLYVGNLGQVDAGLFPPGADYCALGHLHRRGIVGGNPTIRYSGSPLSLDFGDDSEKSLTLVDFGPRGVEHIELCPIPVYRSLFSVSGTLPEILDRLKRIPRGGDDLEPWIDIRVNGLVHEAQEQIEAAAADLPVEILRIRYGRDVEGDDPWEREELQLKELSPLEVFYKRCEFLDEEPDEEVTAAYGELLVQAEHNIAAAARGDDGE